MSYGDQVRREGTGHNSQLCTWSHVLTASGEGVPDSQGRGSTNRNNTTGGPDPKFRSQDQGKISQPWLLTSTFSLRSLCGKGHSGCCSWQEKKQKQEVLCCLTSMASGHSDPLWTLKRFQPWWGRITTTMYPRLPTWVTGFRPQARHRKVHSRI